MLTYVTLNTLGISKDTQLRALQLLKVALEGKGRQLFDFGYTTMKERWEKLRNALSMSKRFSIQEIAPRYCTFYEAIKDPSPGDFSILRSKSFQPVLASYLKMASAQNKKRSPQHINGCEFTFLSSLVKSNSLQRVINCSIIILSE